MMNSTQINFIKTYEKYFFNIDEIDLVILRGHLLIEETLYKIISKFVFHPEYLEKAKLNFSQKIYIARSISLDESNNSMWSLILAINSLRNTIAHELPSEDIFKKLNNIKRLYTKEINNNPLREYPWENHDVKGMKYTVSLSIGFLQIFYEEIKRFKNIINKLDKAFNSHRHIAK